MFYGLGGGVHSGLWLRVCCWDAETLTLHQTMFNCILSPYSRLHTKTPYPILDLTLSFYSQGPWGGE